MSNELIARCDLCKKPLDVTPVEIWKWVLHPECADIVRARLERFAAIVFDMADEEFEAWAKQNELQGGEWFRSSGLGAEYKTRPLEVEDLPFGDDITKAFEDYESDS